MKPGIKSAQKELDKYGIKSVAFNTEEDDTVCHIIGHKQIYVNINYNTSDNTNGGNNNGYLGILEGTGRCKPIGVFSGSNQSGLRTDDFVGTVGSNCTGNSEIFWNTLNSDDANNTDFMIKTNTNTNGGNNNGTLGILEGTGKHGTIGYFSDDFQSGLRTDVSMDSTGMSCVGSSEAFWNTLNSDGANNTDCMRTLVVVDIRGSSTNKDWITDFGTQLDPNWGSFGAGMEMVLKSLYHGTGDTENCKKCNGNSNGYAYCKGYYSFQQYFKSDFPRYRTQLGSGGCKSCGGAFKLMQRYKSLPGFEDRKRHLCIYLCYSEAVHLKRMEVEE